MPTRDPDKRREQKAAQARRRRARQRAEKLGAKSADQTPPHLRPPAELLGAVGELTGALEQFTTLAWIGHKANTAMEMFHVGRTAVQHLDPSRLNPQEALRYIKESIILMEAAMTEDRTRRAEGSETFELSQAVLKHPRARALILELAALSREIRQNTQLAG